MKVTPDDYGRRCQFDHFCKLVNLNNIKTKSALQKYIAMRFWKRPKGFAKPRPRNAPPGRFRLAGRKARGTGCSNPFFYHFIKSMQNKKSSTP